jgi:glycosyltransferase involved in cell wall biosynthesis
MKHLPYFLPPSESAGSTEPVAFPTERPYFLFVGRLVKIKGVQTLLEAFRRYSDADLLIAGDGDYEPELRRLAKGLEHVRFLGRITPDDLRGLYRGAIALLVPAMVYETFGFITLESLGQRTPVIARDLGAVSEVVTDTGGGITYHSEQELLDAMKLLQSNPELRQALGAKGYETYTRQYSEEVHVNAYLEAIREAAGRRPPHGAST